MNIGVEEERKRKRLKQWSIEESFKRQRVQQHEVKKAKKHPEKVKEPKPSSKLRRSSSSGRHHSRMSGPDDPTKRRQLLAQAAEKRRSTICSGITSPEVGSEGSGSDVAVEPCGSRDVLSESDGESGLPEFDDVPSSPPIPEEYRCASSPAEPAVITGGSPLCTLNRTPACCLPLPPLMSQPDHTVLIRPSMNGDFAVPPKPSYSTYRDKWDKDHVRMPCSINNLYPVENSSKKVQNRWELIESTLLGPIKSSHDLQDAILKYNARYSSRWNFEALHCYFNEYLDSSERQEFFDETLPAMVRFALQIPAVCTVAIPLMKRQQNHSITMSQQQAACLLANAFFCTFPRRNSRKHSEYSNFPDVNFNRLFQGGKGGTSLVKCEKLKSVLHYFRSVIRNMPTGTITFQRQVILSQSFPKWDRSSTKFSRLHVSTKGNIEDDGVGFLQVDFANKYIGGGVIGEGCVQEEIRFLVCPEMILSRLFCERIDNNECVFITGAERYSDYRGYAHTFKWDGEHNDETPRDSWGRRYSQLVAIDAHVFHSYIDQFKSGFLKRELDKAYCGFYSPTDSKFLPAIATGNWGCGAFGGDQRLKGIIQMMAASEAHRDLVYFTFGDAELAQDLLDLHSFITDRGLKTGEMWGILHRYGKETAAASSVTVKLFSYIYQLYQRYESDTDPESEAPSTSTSSSNTASTTTTTTSSSNTASTTTTATQGSQWIKPDF